MALMPFVRSSRGTRSRLAPAKISSTISAAYALAYGSASMARWRARIQDHTTAVLARLAQDLGQAETDEWPRFRIALAIDEELAQNGDMEVHEAYLDQHPQDSERAQRPDGGTDPVWSVQRGAVGAPDPGPEAAANPLEALGETVRRIQKRRAQAAAVEPRPQPRRSDWLQMWHALSRQAPHALDWAAFADRLNKLPSDLHHHTSTQWWQFWAEHLDDALLDDPRLYALWALAERRRAYARVVGQDWLDGTSMGAVPGQPLLNDVLADAPDVTGQPVNSGLYRALAHEYFRRQIERGRLDARFAQAFDLRVLCDHIDPNRDRKIDWRAWQTLGSSDSLWTLEEGPWQCHPGRPAPGARELPQWAFLRLAMAMAVDETDPMRWAAAFYQHLSTLSVVPSETLLREGGVPQARYLEDQAARVPDRFEGTQAAIHRAAVGTKWTGTVTLDWRAVRAKGALVAGRRRSQGVAGFLRSIDMGLAAQGRQGQDRPVTVVLPLWHLEAMDFLELPHTATPHLQTVVAVPDGLFHRLRSGEPWHLFDPAVFPEVVDGTEAGYRLAESFLEERLKTHPGSARAVAASRLWRRVLKAAHRGAPYIVFEEAQTPFTPFPLSAPPVAGIDGVGSLPTLPETEDGQFRAVAWPSAAVNLSLAVSTDGTLQIDHLRQSTAVALRLLDNALTASRPTEHGPTALFRPVCLGTVGLYEAIEHASINAHHDVALVDAWVAALAEGWAAVVIQADLELVRERGTAPAWALFPDGRVFDPLGSMERLSVQRHGARSLQAQPRQDWGKTARALAKVQGHRCSVRTVWAPFQGPAALAGVTPGGIGTLQPFERVVDDEGASRLVPTPLLMHHALTEPDRLDLWRQVLRYPQRPRKWPESLVRLVRPDRVTWEQRLHHAALIRPWIDQGVSVTLPAGMPEDDLHLLLTRAWHLGLNSIRFAELPEHIQAPTAVEGETSMDNEGDDE